MPMATTTQPDAFVDPLTTLERAQQTARGRKLEIDILRKLLSQCEEALRCGHRAEQELLADKVLAVLEGRS